MSNHNTETGEIISAYYSRSAQLNELFAALANAQGEFESAKRVGKNPHLNSTYATLEAVLEATAEGRKNNKLALVQMPGNGNGNNIAVTTILGHVSGQWIECRFEVAPSKFDAQGAGSVVTYLRRYAAMSILGIAPEDDDGNAAVAQPSAPTRHVVASARHTNAAGDSGSGAPRNAPAAAADIPGAAATSYRPSKLSEIRDDITQELADPSLQERDVLHAHRESLKLIAAGSAQTYNRLINLGADRIMHALEIADSRDRVDGILRVHKEGLKLIQAASIPTYDRLICLAEERKAELVEPPRSDAGSGSELLGEP